MRLEEIRQCETRQKRNNEIRQNEMMRTDAFNK